MDSGLRLQACFRGSWKPMSERRWHCAGLCERLGRGGVFGEAQCDVAGASSDELSQPRTTVIPPMSYGHLGG